MTRNLKFLGIVLMAVFALSAMTVSVASAANAQFTYGPGPASVVGEQIGGIHIFVSSGRTAECELAQFQGHLGATSTTLTATPEYKDCRVTSAVGGFPMTVTMNGCSIVFHGIETSGKTEAEGKWETTSDVVCPVGTGPITLDFYTGGGTTSHSDIMCTLTIAPQTGLNTIKGTNHPAVPPDTYDDVQTDLNVTGIFVTHDTEPGHSAVLCGNTNMAASYKGTATLRATNVVNEFVNLTISSDP